MDKELRWRVYDTNGQLVAAFRKGLSYLAVELVERMKSGSVFKDGEFHYARGIGAITELPNDPST